MKTAKQLRAEKARLELAARSKLAEIVDGLDADASRKIEEDHAKLLEDIRALDVEITRACATEKERASGTDPVDPADDEDETDEEKAKRMQARADARAGNSVLSRSVVAELVLIDSQARGLGIELALSDAITRGEKPDDMRKRLFAELAKKSDARGPRGTATGLQVTRDEQEGVAGAMEVALITRLLASRGRESIAYDPKGLRDKRFADQHRKQAEQYLGMGLVDLAAACIGYRGRGYLTSADANTIFERAFHSTSDFPAIFSNALNKSLLSRYELTLPTYRQLAVERPFSDFRPHPQIRAGEFPALQPVPETGELKYGSSADSGETVSVSPYGVVFSISRQMLVNDDLGAIDNILASAGDSVLIFENNTFFAMFNSNPVLKTDNKPVFDASHANLGTAAAITVPSISEGRMMLRQMRSLTGLLINVPPRILLTGPVTETAADQILTTITPNLTTSVNPFSGKLVPVTDSNITGNAWYMLTEPTRVPNFIYGFLNGSSGPRTRTFEPFGVQGIKISLEHDFGVGAIDFRGVYKNVGA